MPCRCSGMCASTLTVCGARRSCCRPRVDGEVLRDARSPAGLYARTKRGDSSARALERRRAREASRAEDYFSAAAQRAENGFAVFPRDALGHVARQVGEPARDQLGMLGDVVPALRREGVGADHEAVGELHEHRAPRRVDLAAGGVVGAEREIAPEILVLAQHLAHALGAVEARVRPEDARLRALPEQALDRVDVGVRMQEQVVLFRQRDHAPRHRQIGVGAVQVELADGDIAVASQPILEERDDGLVAHPGADVAAGAVGAQRRHDQVGRRRDRRCLPSSPELETSARLTPALRRIAIASFGGTFPTRRGCSARARRRSATAGHKARTTER